MKMKLATDFLPLYLLLAVAKCHHQEQHQLSPTIATDASLDITALIAQLKQDVTEAVRKEVRDEGRVSYTAQQNLASFAANNQALELRKLTNDVITAVREEVWSVNQLQLAAFYENHNHTCANSNTCSHANANAKVNANSNAQVPLTQCLTEPKAESDCENEMALKMKETTHQKTKGDVFNILKGISCMFLAICLFFLGIIVITFVQHNHERAKKILHAKKKSEAEAARLWR